MNDYPVHSKHFCIDAYKEPDTYYGQWSKCPKCKLKPKTWCFDNGRSTACGCWNSQYDHFSIHAESIMSVHKRTGGKQMNLHDCDGLRKNWNHWCKTLEVTFEHAGKRDDGRW